MLQWKHLESDLTVKEIGELCAGKAWLEVLVLLLATLREPQLVITRRCHEGLIAHLESEKRYELGGILLGEVYALSYRVSHGYPYFTIITDSIASMEYRHSSTSLAMGTELWNRAQPFLALGKTVVGWYHSHPNLGAFFSGVDRATQKAFFCNPYSIGVVFDPVRFEVKSFMGPHSVPLEQELRVIDDSPASLV